MSYNIDTWKTKKLVDFKIPIPAFFESNRKDWHPDRINNVDDTITFIGGCGNSDVTGFLDETGWLHVTEIRIRGEGSGTYMNLILEPAFEQSKGKLVATQVWEGGDSITKLTVEDGNVCWENIEL